MGLEPIIKANSEEEFRELKESYEKFEEHYELKISLGAPEVTRLADDSVTIYPNERKGEIEYIGERQPGLGGTLEEVSPSYGYCYINLEGKIYDIRYNHR